MEQAPLKEKIVDAFQSLPAQLQAAARYVLDHPQDVALLSMREQARQAKVTPATMTRFAQHLGLTGYDAVRILYADAMRSGDLGFSAKAGSQVAQQRLRGGKALAAEIAASVSGQIAALSSPQTLEQLEAGAERLSRARHIYCLGMRSSHAIAWHLHYIMSLCGANSIYLESAGGTGTDALAKAGSQDVLCAVSVLPYTRATVELADCAAKRNIPVFAITDSEVAPLARIAEIAVIVPTQSPSFLHSMSPAFVAAEILGALIAGRRGESALKALENVEHHLLALKIHLSPTNSRRPS